MDNQWLVADLIQFVAEKPRSYEEVMEAWRSSCPRLTIWEDAIDNGLVIVRARTVHVTEAGQEFVACLRAAGAHESAQRQGTPRERMDRASVPQIVVDRSPIGDLGVFTMEALEAGQSVFRFEFVREITDASPLLPERDERPEHCAWIDGRFLMVASPGRYLNHSCDPNSYLRFSPTLEPVDVVARRAVPAGAELTIDYLINNPGGKSWSCNCGSPRCRGETGVSFFRLPEDLQREYVAYLAPWFRRRFSERLSHLG